MANKNKINNHIQQAKYLIELAEKSASQSQISTAINYYKQAIDIVESINFIFQKIEDVETFYQTWAIYYEKLIILLWYKKCYREAFNFIERRKARILIDRLANNLEKIQFSDHVSSDVFNQEEELKNKILEFRKINRSEDKFSQLEQECKKLLNELEKKDIEIASLFQVRTLRTICIQQYLDHNTTLLEYFVTKNFTLAFVITRYKFRVFKLSITKKEIAKKITAFREFLNTNIHHPQELQELYKCLIQPIKDQLATTKLIIVPHNILHHLPFAALTNGDEYLVEKYTLVNLPSANVLRFLPSKRVPRDKPTLFALGNPKNTLSSNNKNLPSAKDEVEKISTFYKESTYYVEENATESKFWEEAPKKSILHISAHGEFQPNKPLESCIYLAKDEEYSEIYKDGKLQVYEVYKLDLSHTDLVVLSACQTYIGNTYEVGNGDEVIGLNWAFIYAGSPTVVASLWNVPSIKTSKLMVTFHENLHQGMTKAEAFQKAQIQVLKSQDPKKKLHPYYWAGFILTGDG
ncbi:CHAT domain-containing protein [Anabaena cylindrica FACHB-243]|nr:CHAT domain-containing protein [Anabaena cylindrica FACHB-243]MBY5283665.1 CHAT domain-containing protein [Anabaena sp. CCAP 1446/1C]MBY5308441.1 CHAT domain-containing protein [Anabaena sp. CCAP 1446/1C]